MKVKTLQSLIDRNSNAICHMERCLSAYKESIKTLDSDGSTDLVKTFYKKEIAYVKAQIRKLVELQKELKTEIGKAVARKSGVSYTLKVAM